METLNFLSIALGLLGTVCSIVFGYALFRRNSKEDDSNDGKQAGVMMSDIGYIKSGVDDIKRKQENQENVNLQMMHEITEAKASAASAHKRIDGIEDRMNH